MMEKDSYGESKMTTEKRDFDAAAASVCRCDMIGVIPLPALSSNKGLLSLRGANSPCALLSRTTDPTVKA